MTSTWSPRSSASRRGAAPTSRSRRSAGRRPSKKPCARRGPAGRRPVLGWARASWAPRTERWTRPGGTLSSLGVYSGKLVAPYEALHAGLGDQRIVTTLCPGGKERMRRLMAMVEHHRVDLSPLVTHRFTLDDILEAYETFSQQRGGVLKVALYPDPSRMPVGALTTAEAVV